MRTHDTAYPIHELLQRRWSPRAFADRPVEPEKLLRVLEAARWAASCFNEQPWRYFVATKEDRAGYDKLLGCLVEKNRLWASSAPVLLLSVASLNFAHNNKANRHAFHDVGAASASLVLEATALGLYVHQMAGFDVAKARTEFAVPDGFEPVAAIALGYLGDPAQLPDDLRQREVTPNGRRPLAEFVFAGTWGQKATVVPG